MGEFVSKLNIKIETLFEKISKSKYFGIISVCIFKAILDFVFIVFAQRYYSYPYVADFNIYKLILSDLLIFLLYIIIGKINNKYSKFFIKTFYLLMFIPISTVYCGKNYSTLSYLLFFLEFVVVIFFVNLAEYINGRIKKENTGGKDKKIKVDRFLKFTTNAIYYSFVLVTLIVIIACVCYNGFPTLKAFDLKKVYEVREDFYLPKFFNYLYTFVTKFILNFLTILFLYKKKYVRFGLAVLATLFIYACKGDKIVLFSIFIVLIIYFAFKLYGKFRMDKLIAPALSIVTLFSVLIYNLQRMPYSVFVNRLLILPSMLKFMYIDFFSNNAKLGIVGTIFNAFLKVNSPYADTSYPNIIGEKYFNSPSMYANTGFLAEGFARMGYIGMIIMPILLGIVIYFVGKSSNKTGLAFTMAISSIPLLNLNDGFLLPSLTFGGILLLIVSSIFFDEKYLELKNYSFKSILNKE